MPKTFITERDIEDLVRRGTMELALNDNVVLTDLAYEKANRLGVRLLQQNVQPPAAPVRPYISQTAVPPAQAGPGQSLAAGQIGTACGVSVTDAPAVTNELKRRVIDTVSSRLAGKVDPAMVATIVERIFADLGVR